jgi:glycosyltransferase involved in cell wall biosynthesis
MKSICIFAPSYDSFMRSYIFNIVNSLSTDDCADIFVYGVHTDVNFSSGINTIIDGDLDYLYKSNDPRIYENFLSYALKNRFDKIFIPRLSHPEYLYSELRLRNIESEVIFSIFAYELFSKSQARRELLIDLICSEKIHKVLIHSILGDHLKFPYEYRADEVVEKINFVSEPLYEGLEEYQCLENRGSTTSNGKPIVLYFGNIFFGKGVDLLFEAASLVTEEMKILVAGNFKKNNFNFALKESESESNIEIIDRYISHEEMVSLFVNCAAVVLPYRKTYEYGTSGVLIQSMLASKPVLVPDFYPFNSVIERYSCGLIFEAGNVKDLARGLDEIVVKSRDFADGIKLYKSHLADWDFFAKKLFDK